MHHMSEGHNLKQFLQEGLIVDVPLHDEHAGPLQQRLAGALQGWVVVVVEVVEPEHAVAAALEGGGDVGADEAGGAGDEHGHAVPGPDAGRGPDPLLPCGAAPAVVLEVAAGGVGEGLRGGGGGRGSEEEDEDQGKEDEGPECELGEGGVPPQAAVGGLVHLELARRRRYVVQMRDLLHW